MTLNDDIKIQWHKIPRGIKTISPHSRDLSPLMVAQELLTSPRPDASNWWAKMKNTWAQLERAGGGKGQIAQRLHTTITLTESLSRTVLSFWPRKKSAQHSPVDQMWMGTEISFLDTSNQTPSKLLSPLQVNWKIRAWSDSQIPPFWHMWIKSTKL